MYADRDIDPIVKDYNRELQKLPEHLRSRASDIHSHKPQRGAWQFRDAEGVLLNPPPVTVTPTRVGKSPTKPLKKYVSKDDLLNIVRKIMRAVREKREEAFGLLEGRIRSIESQLINKSLDVHAYASMEEMSERLDRLESSLQEIADNGLKYRGYWQEGAKAKRGDAYTHNGNLWWAVRSTPDKPCIESVDWVVAVRKGRDAK